MKYLSFTRDAGLRLGICLDLSKKFNIGQGMNPFDKENEN